MEPNYPITRDQLRNYAAVHIENMKNAFVLEGVNFISQTILKDALPNNGTYVYNFRFGTEPPVMSSEIRISELIDVCSKKYPNVYMSVRDGPFDVLLHRILEQVKVRFPDCEFSQDPAKKYLFVDWS